ncbi:MULTISPECIES: hypothetical protein [Pseudomonas]|uniref:Immunity protein 30 domain-containing protein n=1 Tax=Pseudomonas wuhanensis TaxID=2954098 RepID=A0ABY9GLJ5_9PSED|nr:MULTISPECIES: hypothetical protein [unclassified Pseudomonas]WLI10588.1 hypothetical protein PSH65_20245 [Pseudomonas sp. FP603]WLI16402.1 hypothetical protein PSH88_18870 [Pseudomonas sp. FP607]
MEQVTDKDADDAIELLNRFLRDSLDVNAREVPDIDHVKLAVDALILWNNFDQSDYEIQRLIRVLNSKKAISFAELNTQLKPFAEWTSELRSYENARAAFVGPFPDDPF